MVKMIKMDNMLNEDVVNNDWLLVFPPVMAGLQIYKV